MDRPFQRKGAISNTYVGRDFEVKAQMFFAQQGIVLSPSFMVSIGVNGSRKHKFDLGDVKSKIIVECKAHTWTEGGNVPSAKMSKWNEAMYLFYAAPSDYRKILFVLRDYSQTKKETLAEYYIRVNPHLIPKGVEVWEYDEIRRTGEKIR
jgi:hypothetical protein